MRPYLPILLRLLLPFLLFWGGCNPGPDIQVYLDSLSNPLLRTVDAVGRITTDELGAVKEVGYCWNETGNPTVTDQRMVIGKPLILDLSATVGTFEPAKKYYLKAYAQHSSGDVFYSQEQEFTTWDGTLQDVEGRLYKGVQIGNQGWMAENLRTTRYADGTPIHIGTGIANNRTYWYGSNHAYVPGFDQDIDQDGDFDAQDSLLYVNQHGLLYTWHAAANEFQTFPGQKVRPFLTDICPKGWHLPSDMEFQDLRNFLAVQYGYGEYAHHLTSKTGWLDGLNGLDTYGFNMRPGGYWHEPSASHTNLLGRAAYLWMSTSGNDANAFYVQMDNVDKKFVTGIIGKKEHALCVRCLKDK